MLGRSVSRKEEFHVFILEMTFNSVIYNYISFNLPHKWHIVLQFLLIWCFQHLLIAYFMCTYCFSLINLNGESSWWVVCYVLYYKSITLVLFYLIVHGSWEFLDWTKMYACIHISSRLSNNCSQMVIVKAYRLSCCWFLFKVSLDSVNM